MSIYPGNIGEQTERVDIFFKACNQVLSVGEKEGRRGSTEQAVFTDLKRSESIHAGQIRPHAPILEMQV